MAHWPRTVYGNVMMLLLAIGITPMLVSLAGSLTHPLVWVPLVLGGLVFIALAAWRRRVEAARERAWIGSFSFGDVIADMRAREAAGASRA
jgi:K+ transporter